MRRTLLIIGLVVLSLLFGLVLDKSGLGDERRETRPRRIVGEKIEKIFNREGERAVLQILDDGDSVIVESADLGGSSVVCVIGKDEHPRQTKRISGSLDGVRWSCTGDDDAKLLAIIEREMKSD